MAGTMTTKILYTDGGCKGNEQRTLSRRQMTALVTDADGVVLAARVLPGGSNNIAELLAVQYALEWCVLHEVPSVEIRTDSRNTLAWVKSKRVGKNCNDRAYVLRIKQRIATLRHVIGLTLTWIPREENKAGHKIEVGVL